MIECSWRRPWPRTTKLKGERIYIGEHPLAHVDAARNPSAMHERLEGLRQAGITCLLDLTAPEEMPGCMGLVGEVPTLLGPPLRCVRATVPASPAAGMKGIRKALDTLDRLIAEGHTVYVHAKGIGGRLSSVIGCHFVRSGYTAEKALERLEELWRDVRDASGFPVTQTEPARRAVRAWSEGRDLRLLSPIRPVSRYLRDGIRGAMIGLAVGDAMGVGADFRRPEERSFIGGGPDALRPGEWSSATSMALCLLESHLQGDESNIDGQMERYRRWWEEGEFSSNGSAVGASDAMRRALYRYQYRSHTGATPSTYGDELATDASPLCRIAPVAILWRDRPAATKLVRYSVLPTHSAQSVFHAAAYLAELIQAALDGANKAELLSGNSEWIGASWLDAASAERFQRAVRAAGPHDPAGGYAMAALRRALQAFHDGSSFEEGGLIAARLEREAPGTAAIFGQIAGAFYGERAIPREWRQGLARPDLISRYAELLAHAALGGHFSLTREPAEPVARLIRGVCGANGDPREGLEQLLRQRPDLTQGGSSARPVEMEAVRRLRIELGVHVASAYI